MFNFQVLTPNKKQKKNKKPKKILGIFKASEERVTTRKLKPKFLQIEACLYLGSQRISMFSYSKPYLFGQSIKFQDDELCFYSV
jgi:hypothetical protein